MTVIAIFAVFAALYLIQEQGHISQSLIRKFASLFMCVVSCALFSAEYGVLRGVFITIGVVSLLGTVFTLLRYKLVR